MKLNSLWQGRIAVAACSLTTVWMPSPSQAQVAGFPITISVDATKNLAAVNPRLTGANLLGSARVKPSTPTAASSPGSSRWPNGLAGGPLRYPGGENADSYDWAKGVGPAATRSAMSYYPSASSNAMASEVVSFGTEEYLEYCRRLACTPVLQLNLHQGSPDEAAARAVAWLRHVNLQTLVGPTGAALPKVQYWELGNEPYLKDSHFGADANALFVSNADFVARINKVMAAMLAVDPTVRFILPFALDTWSGAPYDPAQVGTNPATVVGEHLGYAKALLDGITQLNKIQALALHYYMPIVGTVPAGATVPSDLSLYWATMAGALSVPPHLDAVRRFWATHPRAKLLPQPKLSVTELNSLYTTNQPPLPQNNYTASQTGAVFVADLLRVLANQPDVDLATAWSMSRNGPFGAISFDETPGGGYAKFVRPHYQALKWGRELLASGNLLGTTVSAPTSSAYSQRVGFSAPVAALPLSTAQATRAGKQLTVLVTNKDVGSTGNVQVTVNGALVSAASVKQLSSTSQFATDETKAVSTVQNYTFKAVATPTHLGFTAANNKSVLKWDLPRGSFALLTLTLR